MRVVDFFNNSPATEQVWFDAPEFVGGSRPTFFCNPGLTVFEVPDSPEGRLYFPSRGIDCPVRDFVFYKPNYADQGAILIAVDGPVNEILASPTDLLIENNPESGNITLTWENLNPAATVVITRSREDSTEPADAVEVFRGLNPGGYFFEPVPAGIPTTSTTEFTYRLRYVTEVQQSSPVVSSIRVPTT